MFRLVNKVPEGGQYRFKRPAIQGGWWRIAGEMKLLRVLPESESNALLNEYVASKEYTDAVAKKAPKQKATAENKLLTKINQSKAFGIANVLGSLSKTCSRNSTIPEFWNIIY